MYTISKTFHFSASHLLHHLPEGHPCGRLHGHNYVAELILRTSVLDERGFVVDYNEMHPFADYIAEYMDHRHLNGLIAQPTAEHIAKHLYDVAWKLWHHVAIIVRVSETPRTWAEYSETES